MTDSTFSQEERIRLDLEQVQMAQARASLQRIIRQTQAVVRPATMALARITTFINNKDHYFPKSKALAISHRKSTEMTRQRISIKRAVHREALRAVIQ
jgi:hypothetical protein